MANPTDESPGEDLFDDLDKFFAPIEETDWPEPAAGASPPRARSRPSPRASEPPAANDLFPEGWDSIDESEEGEGEGLLEAAASPAPDDTSTYEFSIDDVNEPEAPSAPAFQDEAEDSDWGAAAVGTEGEEEESFLFGEDESPAPAAASPGRGAEPREPGELTLDDLKVAPPEYSALPGPEDERPAPSSIFGDEELSFATADPPAPAPREPVASAPPPPPDPGASERAADHFADGVRADTGRIEDDLLAGLDSTPTTTTPRTVKVGTDEPVMGHGPAWEDPTSQAVINETGGAMPRMGRNMSAALVSGVFLGALALILLAIGPAPFAYLAGAVLLAAQAELYAVARTRGYQPATALGLVIGGLIVYAGYNKGEAAMSAMLVLGLILTYLWYMAAPQKARRGTIGNAAITVLGIVYIPFMAAFIFRILPFPGGRAIVISIIALNVIYDVSAFGIGSLWGNRSLAATISPNKSWEGAIAASLISLFAAIAFGPQIDPFTVGSSLGMALVVIVMAPLGDLAESALKRDLGVKDMSTVMPGHGGLLDRVDSLLFVLPAAYFFLRIVFF